MGEIEEIRVVIDTNVIISTILWGIPGKLIDLWKNGRIKPLTSREILDEYIKVLAYPKFELSESEINYILYSEMLPYFYAVFSRPYSAIFQKDPSDDNFIHCVISWKTDTIISGDQHFLNLKTYQNKKFLTPTEFLSNLKGLGFF